jgi:hypothetical protein
MDAPGSDWLGAAPPQWDEANRAWLVAAMARLADRLAATAAGQAGEPLPDAVRQPEARGFEPALLTIARIFGLSSFEREVLLLLAGLEIDNGLRRAFAAAGGIDGRASFGLALGLLTAPHWDALSPEAPLRHWKLVAPEPGQGLSLAPLRLDERILHAITGIPASDGILGGVVIRVAGKVAQAPDLALARRIAGAARTGAVVVLDDPDPVARRDWALAAASVHRGDALWLEARDLPARPESIALLARHVDREALLDAALPVLSVADGPAGDALALAARMATGMIWLGQAATGLSSLPNGRRVLRIGLPARDPRQTRDHLLASWRDAFGENDAVEAQLRRAAVQFRLHPGAVDGLLDAVAASDDPESAVWPAARAAARGGLDALAQRVETRARFDDVVVPPGQARMLHDVAHQLRQRDRVFHEWGFGERYGLGQGLVALFAGESGTGKTLAAEAIANEAGLDLYRVDLATLVSKYIGETEKNLKQLFDAADASGAVLLFDEADALFGKRSEVKDSHDRYANIEVAYLLQRVEAYRGLAILTTNMKSALDRAFLRRIRFVVNFPMPDAAARERIWRRQFPAAAPMGSIDFKALAKLNVCGGNIRSIALGAAFKAADAGSIIDQALLMTAAHEEAAKLERSLGRDRGRAT